MLLCAGIRYWLQSEIARMMLVSHHAAGVTTWLMLRFVYRSALGIL